MNSEYDSNVPSEGEFSGGETDSNTQYTQHETKQKKSNKTKKKPKNIPERTGRQENAEEKQSKTDMKEEIVNAQAKFIDTLAASSSELSKTNRKGLTKSYQELISITLNLLEENAFLKGKLENSREIGTPSNQENTQNSTSERDQNQSYAEVVEKSVRNQENTQKKQEKQQTSAQPQARKVEGLLLYCTKDTINPAAKIKELLKQNFNPTELGLGQPNIREVRNGILITSGSALGIANLKKAIEQNEKTKTTLTTKEPQKRYPQFLISGVPRDVTEDDFIQELLQHNKINGESEEVIVRNTFPEKSGTRAIVVEVSPQIFHQLKEHRKVYISWTVCSLRENIHIPRCSNCCQFGHTRNTCKGRAVCAECGSYEHIAKECNSDEYGCNACMSYNSRTKTDTLYTNHAFAHNTCPTLEHLITIAKSRISYT